MKMHEQVNIIKSESIMWAAAENKANTAVELLWMLSLTLQISLCFFFFFLLASKQIKKNLNEYQSSLKGSDLTFTQPIVMGFVQAQQQR